VKSRHRKRPSLALELTQKRMTERGSKVKLVVREAVGDFLHY